MNTRVVFRHPDESVSHYEWDLGLGHLIAACGARFDPLDTLPSAGATPICSDCAASPQPDCRSGVHGYARVPAVTGRVQVPLCQSCAYEHDTTALTLFGEALAQIALDFREVA